MTQINYFDEFMKKYQADWDTPKSMSDEALDWWARHIVQINMDIHKSEYMKKSTAKAMPDEYKYMITFTLDPKKVDMRDESKKVIIEDYIVGLLKVPENHRFYYSREHEDTNTHWHTIIHRKTPFKQDKLAYYKKKYGNFDVSRSKILTDDSSIKYLGKESEIITIK